MEIVNCPISENAKLWPDHFSLITEEYAWTYREFDAMVHHLCLFLKNLGIQENDRVPFIAKTSVATICLFFALFRLKAIACPLSFRIPQAQIDQFLKQLRPNLLLDPESLPLATKPHFSPPNSIHLDQLATFLFTSGSSGMPKIVCHSFGNHYYNAMGALSSLQLESSSRWLLSLPLFHVGGIGILFRCFIQGAGVVLGDNFKNVSHVSLVPTQLYRILKQEKMDQSLKCILLGGAPIPPSLFHEPKAADLPIYTTYGMTEMSSIIALSSAHAKSVCGKVLPFRHVKIAKDQEIWVGGKTLFKGYWNGSAVVKADVDGWFPTKDLGSWTENDELEVIGRKDRQFISGGENIQPEEIERALCSLTGIRQATVLPLADEEFGQRPIAFIEDETRNYTLETLREALNPRLPRFMHPVRIFPYPAEMGLKPSLGALEQHLVQVLASSAKNRE